MTLDMLRRDQPAMTVLLGALIAVAPLAMDIYLASMPSMTRALSATPEQVQLTLSLYMYGWGLSQIFVGPLTDRYGRRPLLVAGRSEEHTSELQSHVNLVCRLLLEK